MIPFRFALTIASLTASGFSSTLTTSFALSLANEGESVDVVFMDPPRNGSDEKFLSSVVTLRPKRIVYVSCEPTTLARDLKYLTKHGYRAVTAVPFDMFPATEHVETVVLLQRKNM